MDLAYLQSKISYIVNELHGDDEAQHSKQDDLLWRFVEVVASGEPTKRDQAELAKELLKLRDAPFARWCA